MRAACRGRRALQLEEVSELRGNDAAAADRGQAEVGPYPRIGPSKNVTSKLKTRFEVTPGCPGWSANSLNYNEVETWAKPIVSFSYGSVPCPPKQAEHGASSCCG